MSESPTCSLDALRSAGAARLDPVRFHYLEVLSRRVTDASGDVQRVLQAKLDHALAQYGERLAQAPQAARAGDLGMSSSSPLLQLNQYIRQRLKSAEEPGSPGHDEVGGEIQSARRFRATWSRIAAEQQVNDAFGRGPENAGPLNAHMLVLHSLRLMRDLSPHYLQQFLSQVDSLLWLEQVNQKYTLADAKPARPSRPKK